jgi:hypothetical protein
MRDRKNLLANGRRRNSLPATQIEGAPASPKPTAKESSVVITLEECAEDCRSLVEEVNSGLEVHAPELSQEGVNGTYFLRNLQGTIIAVFKPEDEQGDTPRNPKIKNGSLSSSNSMNGLHRKGLVEGEVSLREAAAYLLDKRHNHVYKVPKTCLVKLRHPYFNVDDSVDNERIGSLQEFIESEGSAGDIGSGAFPVREVHTLGILDVRIFNTDRHDGNILITKASSNNYKLTPIDHSYSLPHSMDAAWFDWLNWQQAKKPFDEETKRHIESLDVETDCLFLNDMLHIRPECLRVSKISTTLLKKAVKYGLTLFDIGNIVCRSDRDSDQPSELEMMCQLASQRVSMSWNAGVSEKENEELFLNALYNIMDEQLAERRIE